MRVTRFNTIFVNFSNVRERSGVRRLTLFAVKVEILFNDLSTGPYLRASLAREQRVEGDTISRRLNVTLDLSSQERRNVTIVTFRYSIASSIRFDRGLTGRGRQARNKTKNSSEYFSHNWRPGNRLFFFFCNLIFSDYLRSVMQNYRYQEFIVLLSMIDSTWLK